MSFGDDDTYYAEDHPFICATSPGCLGSEVKIKVGKGEIKLSREGVISLRNQLEQLKAFLDLPAV